MPDTSHTTTKRPPVVAIMGHIDHGKSTLLSYIRKSALALNEAGGITQHISAYEVEHPTADGVAKITFIDTPGHAAFSGHRNRGASIADVCILVVSAEDGVKPQTVEALNSIKKSNTPYIVAITKTDKPDANIERTKQSLAEHDIFVEGYGGDIPMVAVSGKTGAGIPELLDMILLVADLENLMGDRGALASGMIIENNLDIRKGISATCIITNGSLVKGNFVISEQAITPVRMVENWKGQPIQDATFSMPIKLIGWDSLPTVGSTFKTFETKKEAEEYIKQMESGKSKVESREDTQKNTDVKDFPLVIKADTGGSLEALTQEIMKSEMERIRPHIVFSGIGAVSENDIRMAKGKDNAIVIGFHVKVDPQAKTLAERDGVTIQHFDVIYTMSEWLKETLLAQTPKREVEEQTGEAKVLKMFSKVKDKQVIGCRMETGSMHVGDIVKIMRRDSEIGSGKVRELQSQKLKISSVEEGKEFGTLVEAKIEIAPGDKLQVFTLTQK